MSMWDLEEEGPRLIEGQEWCHGVMIASDKESKRLGGGDILDLDERSDGVASTPRACKEGMRLGCQIPINAAQFSP